MPELHPSIAHLLARPEHGRRIGPFLLVRQLGRGGFAPVWLAREIHGAETLRAAAVKLFALETSAGEATRRIVEEARALCRVEHENIVRFLSLALDEDAGVMGLAMEHVAGRTVAARLTCAGPFAAGEVLDLGIALASALSAVHRVGLVHRDVKPGNIMETAGGFKLIDFGIASTAHALLDCPGAAFAGDAETTVRLTAACWGTPGYVDPEMSRTLAPASSESDLYALGATLHECLSGRLPAEMDDGRLDPRILKGSAAPPRMLDRVPGAPPALAAFVDRLVHPRRRARPASAAEVLSELERLRDRRSLHRRSGRALVLAGTAIAAVSLVAGWAVEHGAPTTIAAPQASPPTAPQRSASGLDDEAGSRTPAAVALRAAPLPLVDDAERPRRDLGRRGGQQALSTTVSAQSRSARPGPPPAHAPSRETHTGDSAPPGAGRPALPLAPARDF